MPSKECDGDTKPTTTTMSEEVGLKRELGFIGGTSMIVGLMIGIVYSYINQVSETFSYHNLHSLVLQ